MKYKILVLFVLTGLMYSADAQKVKFGKVSKDLLTKPYSEIDSSAAAEVIYESGDFKVEFDNNTNWFATELKTYIRIKVFDKDRYSNDLDISIPINPISNISKIRCVTYNLKDGKIEKIKLPASSVFHEKVNEYITNVKFAIPSVQNGSVIEYEYTIRLRGFHSPNDWYFQRDYPVVMSSYYTQIPEFFKFNTQVKGYADVEVKHNSSSAAAYNIDYTDYIHDWTAENVPAFIPEPYTVNYREFLTAVSYELVSYRFPMSLANNIALTWEDMDEKLRDNSSFYGKIRMPGIAKTKLKEIITPDMTDMQKAQAIYKYVQTHTKWSGYNIEFSSLPFKKVLSDKHAHSGDINLLLTSMLNTAGLDVCPVILSTRGNGKLYEHMPTSKKINYVICRYTDKDKVYYLDATDKNLMFGQLPKRCLNGMARAVCEKYGENFELVPAQKYKKRIVYQVDLEDDISHIVKTETRLGYAALETRTEIEEAGSEDTYIKKLTDEFTEMLSSDIKLTNPEDLAKPVELVYDYDAPTGTSAGNMYFFVPLQDEATDENPFKLDERQYPVDYAYPTEETVIAQYKLPEGWTVSEKPENLRMILPDKSASYLFSAQVIGNTLQVIRKFSINKPVFFYNEYADLKNFYDLIAKKEAEKIVITIN